MNNVYLNYLKLFTSGNLEGATYPGFLSFADEKAAREWVEAVKASPALMDGGALGTSGFRLLGWQVIPCRGVLVTYEGHVYQIENLEWNGFDPDVCSKFNSLTDANSLSGADPIPDLAMAYRLKKFYPGLDVIFFTKPKFDPEVVY